VLKEPFGAFLQHLACDQGFAVSLAALKKYRKDIAKNPVGTGPYRFESQVPG
jgi:ABC-type oligopeptide transport system substrate-binding subunit